jgi:tRNA wybutosine-synthesizing protein 3
MLRDRFLQRKTAVLSKIDKSSAGKWDKKIKSLCDKVNSKSDFYTTSSCSGRIVLIIDKEKKLPNLFLKVWHEEISLKELKKSLNQINKKDLIKFKFEPPILHVVCKNLESAVRLLENAKTVGFKHSGINTLGKNILLELNGSERLEFPIFDKRKILVSDDFLKIIVQQANEKLKKGWESIKKLEKRT